MSENSVDKPADLVYNVDNNDQMNFVVKMDEQKPINDTECTHETLIEDPKDTLGKATYHGCANLKCGRGWYIQK